jgi:DNA-binding NarL/FixJ family response regulator
MPARLLAALRRISPRSAVVLMTAYGTPEVVSGALDLGASRVLSKPFEMHDLVPLLVRVCGPDRPVTRRR